MERVQGQKRGFRDLAIQALSWITCTRRPLAKLELQHALATTENASSIDKGNITEIELIVSVCAGLITVDEESGIIRLIHYTTQEFFERTQKSYFIDVQEQIARTCITYLLFDDFSPGFCETDDKFEARTHQSPLYSYAAHYWGDHTKGTSLERGTLILSFLESDTKVAAASQMMFAVKRHPYDMGYSQRFPKGITGLHHAAHFGLSIVTAILLKRGSCRIFQNTYGWTPLWMAARNGQGSVVEILLAEKTIDCDTGDARYNRSPLIMAAENGHASVVEILLEKIIANPNSTDNYRKRTPLAWAAQNGHEDVVKRLLTAKGIDVDSKDKDGRTPLWLAARNGHRAVVELLLGIDDVVLDFPDNFYHQTPLSAAAAKGHEDVVNLLIARGGVNLNVKDTNGQTPLYLASENGHESVVKRLLILDNIDQDATDTRGRTPLSAAAARGHFTVIESLLTSGANPYLKDNYGWTPFLWASANGQRNAMQLLQPMDDVRGHDEQKKDHNEELQPDNTNLEPENSENSSDSEIYYIAWICTLPVEMAAARGMMDEIHVDLTEHPKDGYIYLLGCISGHNVVVACPETLAKETASLVEVGSRILRTFTSVRAALLVGIGGGAPTKIFDIRLGDVVVSPGPSRNVIQDDCAESGLKPILMFPPVAFLTAISALESNHMLSGNLITAFLSEMEAKHPSMSADFTSCSKHPDQLFDDDYDHVGASGNCEDCDINQLIARPPRIDDGPVVHQGITFSSPKAMCSGQMREQISTKFGALCFEAQAAGWNEDFPALLIRGISSYADSHGNEKWQEYAAAAAAAYAKELLRKVFGYVILNMQAVTIATSSPEEISV